MRGKFTKDYWIIRRSGLFDKAYYLKQYDDVRKADIDPIEHYVLHGWKEGRNPAPWFDTRFYLENNPDVAKAGVNPFVHWIRWGRWEGRKTNSILTNEEFFISNSNKNKNKNDKIRFLAKVIFEISRKPYLVGKFLRDLKAGGIYYAIYKTKAYINRKDSLHVEQRADSNGHKNETSSCSLLIEYFNQLFENTKKLNERETFVPYKEHERINTDIKLVAFYLPQFHPIPENDEFWEKGFTEWTNVTKAVPQFLGHYQPRLPIDLGFYDLRLIDNIKRQVELAKNYGIYGFAFHHYWFEGRKVLRTPIELFLKHKEIDFKFCVHFANENWTRRWDGLDHEVLLKQKHSPEDDIKFIEDTARYFMDERYIRIKGKPLIIVYRPELFPNIKETVERWREWCIKNGIGDIYLACVHSFVHTDPREIGFDAAIDYPPNTYPLTEFNEKFTIINPNYQGRILSYDELIHISKSMPKPPYKKFRGICPSWDNEARRPGRGTVVHGSTPEKYEAWLTYLLEYTENNFEPEERFIFINAWNEWAEGAYLEPDRKFGYGYLEATWRALYKFNKKNLTNINKENLRILFISHDANFGGAQKVLLNLMDFIKKYTNAEILTLILRNGNYLEIFKEKSKILLFDKVINEKECIKELEKFAPDIIYVNTSSCIGIYEIIKNLNKPIITHVHELKSSIRKYSSEEHMQEMVRYTDYFIVVSQAVKDMLIHDYGVDESKISVIYPFINIENKESYKTEKIQIRKKLGLPESKFIVLGCGIGMPFRKGADLFIKVAEIIQVEKHNMDILFYWIGGFDGEEYDEKFGKWHHWINYIEQKNINVTFTGFLKNPNDYYKAADIFLLTSREDPFPLVMIETALNELPVLCFSNSGGGPEFLKDEDLICQDYKDMALKVLKLKENEDLRRSKGYELRKKALNCCIQEIGAWNIYTLIRDVSNKNPLVSVIVPNYNYAKYLPQRMKSILEQTCKDMEIIVLDDASTDLSVEILNSYKEKYRFIKLIVNKKNSGSPFKQWIKGIREARGKYVWIAEADDLSECEFLAELLDKMENDDSLVLAYCRSLIIDEHGKIIGDYATSDYILGLLPPDKKDKFLRSYISSADVELNDGLILNNYIPNISSVLFRKKYLDLVNIDELKQFKMCGDWYLIIKLLKHGNIYYCSKPLNYHRRHSESVFGKLLKNQTEEQAEIFFNEYFKVLRYALSNYEVESSTKERLKNYIKVLWKKHSHLSFDDFIKKYGIEELA